MRCTAFCIATKLDLTSLAYFFQSEGYYVKFYKDVLYLYKPNTQEEIFCFAIGCFVTWGLTRKATQIITRQIQRYASSFLTTHEVDSFIFFYGDKTELKTHERYNVDIITLEDEDIRIKLAISYGLAQSVKLESYEETVLATIAKNQDLPKSLAEKGRIHLSSRAILKRIGEILAERSLINLNSEYLDMPEYFWRFPSLEKDYIKTASFLELTNRFNSLNKRLDTLKEILEMLHGQLQHRHSSLLETIIIVLIFIEIILSLVHWS